MDQQLAFGVLLSRYRVAVGLTQEELAARAELSVRGISDLERGRITWPRAATVRQLAAALDLSPDDRSAFEHAARAAGAATPGAAPVPGYFLGALPPHSLVARQDECARIGTILDLVAGGAGHVLLLSGELGVGKTRLMQEVMVAASTRGYVVLTGRCDSAAQGTPYAPFLDALRELPAQLPAPLRSAGQRGVKQMEQLVRGREADTHPAAGHPLMQHELVSVVSDLLVLLARTVPLALLLDDLQWADTASLTLLLHLAHTTRNAPILLASTFQEGSLGAEHPDLAYTLQTLSRERLAERIGVRRLSLEETTTLVATTMGRPDVSDEFAGFVYRRTKGTPRLIEGLVRSLGGRLELQGEIGAGAMGRVFRAFDRTTGTTVAAKLVLARQEIALDTMLRFQQEGAVLAALDHPHIVRMYDTFAEEHASCIIMELLDGPSLGQLLRDGPLPLPRARSLAVQVAAALSYAHAQGIVHRDVKPDNVMVLAHDQVKVTDFGIARLLRPDTSLQTIATTGMRLGTPLYMAPEQIAGKKIDGRTDVYALGAMLFHMVTGRPPYEGGDALAVALKHLQEQPLRPSALNPAVPADWDALILKALEKDPARRYPSARELEVAIAALGEQARMPLRLAGRPRWVAATSAALLCILVAVVVTVVAPALTAARPPRLGARLDTYLAGLAATHQLSGTVLVARQGAVVLAKGYGLADQAHNVPNTATTRYPVGTVGATFSVVSLLQGNEAHVGRVAPASSLCRYLARCPASWRPITVRMVLEGTSHLPDYGWGQPGNTTDQTVAACQAEPLVGYPLSTNNDCDTAVLATILARTTNAGWDADLAGSIFAPAGMVNSGWMTDVLAAGAPGFALDYDGATADPRHVYNDFFTAYSTAPDLYAYDNALFGGQLLAPQDTAGMLAPRSAVSPPDPDIVNPRWGDYWRIGRLFGRRVVYTIGNANAFVTVNMRFPDAGVTVIVITNDQQNDTVGVALHAAALVFGQHLAPPPPIQTSAPAALLGTYRRTFQDADRRAAHDPGLADWVGVSQSITIRTGRIDNGPPNGPPVVEEYYTATRDGRLTLLGYPPGNQSGYCADIPTETPPTGYYRWARQGRTLIITRMAFDPCLDRGALMPGRWTKVG